MAEGHNVLSYVELSVSFDHWVIDPFLDEGVFEECIDERTFLGVSIQACFNEVCGVTTHFHPLSAVHI